MRRLTLFLAAAAGALLLIQPVWVTTSAEQNAAPVRGGGLAGIAGKVLDASGRPVPGTVVTVLWHRDAADDLGRLAYNVKIKSTTNANGEFRLDGLDPGSYYVIAFPPNYPVTAAREPNRRGHAVTYYPSGLKPADAKPLVILPSAITSANITLVGARIGEISGSVIASNGRPVRSGTLLVTHGDGLFGLDGSAVSIAPDGSFRVLDVAPGTYHLHWREGVWPVPRDVIPKISVAKVVVADRDFTGVRVVPIRMVKTIGRIIASPAIRKSAAFSTLSVVAVPRDTDGNPGPQRPGRIRDDLTFEFHTWPGIGYVRVSMEAGGQVLATVRLNGTDVTKTGVDFREGQELRGVEITLSDRPLRPSPAVVRPPR